MVALSQWRNILKSVRIRHLPYVTLSLASIRLNKCTDSYEVHLIKAILPLQLSVI